jgi:primosomal replication protein N
MRTKYFFNLLIIAIFIAILTACNDDNNSSNIAGGGISGTGITIGPISALGSIFVNDVEFETNNAVITVNKQSMTANALQVGMIVQVEGIIQSDGKTGTASRINFNENVKGPIQFINDNTNTINILGQTVLIDRFTAFEGMLDWSDLKVGEVVSVSGLVDANATIHATWIKRENHLTEFEVIGSVANLDRITQTFTIGNLTINYSQTLRLNVPEGILNNGLLVEVKGVLAGTLAKGVLMANHIEKEDELLNVEAGTKVEIEGFITQFHHRFDFEVAWLAVTTTAQTIFQWGHIEDLALGTKVEVEGKLDRNGILVLEEVTFPDAERPPAERIEIEAKIEALDSAEQTITLLGLPVQITPATQFRDRRDAEVPFGLTNLRLSDRVAVSGFLDAISSILTAETLLRQPFRADGQVILEGPASHIDWPAKTLTILDITILTDSNTIYEDENADETELNAEIFFANIQPSAWLIEVQGIWMGHAILATKLEVER